MLQLFANKKFQRSSAKKTFSNLGLNTEGKNAQMMI